MSAFDDPAFMQQSKAELRGFLATGRLPDDWRRDRWRGNPPGRPLKVCFNDTQLRVICEELMAGHHNYAKTAAKKLGMEPRKIFDKVSKEGGRRAFLQKYGVLTE